MFVCLSVCVCRGHKWSSTRCFLCDIQLESPCSDSCVHFQPRAVYHGAECDVWNWHFQSAVPLPLMLSVVLSTTDRRGEHSSEKHISFLKHHITLFFVTYRKLKSFKTKESGLLDAGSNIFLKHQAKPRKICHIKSIVTHPKGRSDRWTQKCMTHTRTWEQQQIEVNVSSKDYTQVISAGIKTS